MLRSTRAILGYGLAALDGELGKVADFYFDDHAWTVRYLVADTDRWLAGRLVLLSPMSIQTMDWEQKRVHLSLTRQQIEDSPSIEQDLPVGRQRELEIVEYYGWLPYWQPSALSFGAIPPPINAARPAVERAQQEQDAAPSLRSTREVEHYHIRATDGSIGHVTDFIVETDGWMIRYLVADTRNWLPGRKVLLAPDWIAGVDWEREEVAVDLTRDQVKGSPVFDPAAPVNRAAEQKLYDYYGRPGYWD